MADLEKQLPAVIDKQLPAVIKKTTTEVAKLEPKLEKVNNEITEINGKSIGLAEITGIFKQTNVQSNILINQFNTMIDEIEYETEVIMDETEEIDKAAKATVNWAGVFDVLASSLSYVEKGFEGIWTSLNSTMDYMEVYNSYADSFGKIAEEWSGDYQKYGYENAQAYANSFTDRMDDTIAKLTGIKFDDENVRMVSAGVKNLGLNIKDVTQTATQIASISNSLGLTGESTLAASSAFAKLAGDLSSLYNVDYSSISQEIQSGLEGQTDALRKYGIELSDATLQSYAYKSGMQKTVSEMTEAEKMQLRMVAILDQSESAWGNLADEINGPSNQIKMFKSTLAELEQLFGQLFMPAFQKVMPFVNGIALAVKELLSSIAGIFGIEVKYDAQDPVDINTESATGTLSTIQSEDSAVGSVLDMIAQYETVWGEAYENMESKAQQFAEQMTVIFAPIEQLFEDIKIGDWFAVGGDVSTIASSIFDFFSDAINSVQWEEIGNEIGRLLAGIEWDKVIESGLELTFEVGDKIADVWFGVFETAPIETAIITALAGAKFLGLGNAIGDAMLAALGLQGVSLAAPLVITITSLVFAYKVGEEKEELEKNISELGEEEGRIASGTGVMDKAALYQYDKENADMAVTQAGVDAFLGMMESVSTFFNEWGEDIKIGVDKCWEALRSLFSLETWQGVWEQLKKWFDETIKPWFTKEKWIEILSGMVEALPEPIQNAIKSAIELLNSFIDTINDVLKIEWDAFYFGGKKIFDGGAFQLVTIPNIPDITAFSLGGFPEDGLFMANHGELVGKFSNGKTAVANNEQIVSGIKQGVREAISEVLTPYLADIAQNTQDTANKDFATYIGDKEIARASERGRRAIGLQLITEF